MIFLSELEEIKKHDARQRRIKQLKFDIHVNNSKITELQQQNKECEKFIDLWSDESKVREFFEIPKDTTILSSPQYFAVIYHNSKGKLFVALQDVDGTMRQFDYDLLK